MAETGIVVMTAANCVHPRSTIGNTGLGVYAPEPPALVFKPNHKAENAL